MPILRIRPLLLALLRLRRVVAIRRALWVTAIVVALFASQFPALIDALIGPMVRPLIGPLVKTLAGPLVWPRPAAWIAPGALARIKPRIRPWATLIAPHRWPCGVSTGALLVKAGLAFVALLLHRVQRLAGA